MWTGNWWLPEAEFPSRPIDQAGGRGTPRALVKSHARARHARRSERIEESCGRVPDANHVLFAPVVPQLHAILNGRAARLVPKCQ